MKHDYLATVDDSVTMTPEVFTNLMRRFKHHNNVKYGFSKKHTLDIRQYRSKIGVGKGESTVPGNLYNLPVTWDTAVTYVS